MIKVAVLGATGYAGIELVRLLSNHPEVSLEILGSQSFAGQKISEVYQNFEHILDKECEKLDLDKVKECDVAFTALPHGASKEVIPALLAQGVKVMRTSDDVQVVSIAKAEKEEEDEQSKTQENSSEESLQQTSEQN